MNPPEAQLFALLMSLVLLKKTCEAIKKGDEKKARKYIRYGKLYVLLASSYQYQNYYG